MKRTQAIVNYVLGAMLVLASAAFAFYDVSGWFWFLITGFLFMVTGSRDN